MRFWALVLAVFVAGWAGSCAANMNTAAPASRPSAADSSSAVKSANKFPTPAELMAKIQAAQKEEEQTPKVAYFDLSAVIGEKPADFNLFDDDPTALTLRVLIDRLEKARQDGDVHAVLLRLGDGTLNLSQAMELRDELVHCIGMGSGRSSMRIPMTPAATSPPAGPATFA